MSAAVMNVEVGAARKEVLDPVPWDPWLLLSALLLAGLGVVMVYSSSAMFAKAGYHDATYFLKRQAVFVAAGLVLMATVMRVGYRRLEGFVGPLLVLGLIGLVATYIPGLGVRAGGAQRWLKFPGFQLQPSEFVKIALCLYLARSVARKGDGLRDFKVGFLPHLMVFGLFGGLVLGQPDFGSTAVLAALLVLVLFVAGARMSYLVVAVGVAVPLAYVAIASSEYRMRRVLAFLDPLADRYGKGYQPSEALMSVSSGGLSGVGLGAGPQKLGFLPAGHTDYTLASIGEELGLIGIVLVLALFSVLLWGGLRAALRAGDAFGAYLALAVTSLLAMETVINTWMCLSMLPSKGIALPFVSYGGTSVLKSFVCAGLLLSVSEGRGGWLAPAQGASRCT